MALLVTANIRMPAPLSAADLFNAEFLEIRAKILQLAAHFDRLDHAAGGISDDPRRAAIRTALGVLHEDRSDRAERVQLIFSRQYESNWRTSFGV